MRQLEVREWGGGEGGGGEGGEKRRRRKAVPRATHSKADASLKMKEIVKGAKAQDK